MKVLGALALAAAMLATAHAPADCLVNSIGDYAPGNFDRYMTCKWMEDRFRQQQIEEPATGMTTPEESGIELHPKIDEPQAKEALKNPAAVTGIG